MFCGCVWLGYARILAPQGCASLTLGCVLAPRGCASLTPGCVLAPIQGARCSDDRKPGVALRLPRAVFCRPFRALDVATIGNPGLRFAYHGLCSGAPGLRFAYHGLCSGAPSGRFIPPRHLWRGGADRPGVRSRRNFCFSSLIAF